MSPASPVTTLLLKAFLRPWKRLHVSAWGGWGVAVPLMQPFLFGNDMRNFFYRKRSERSVQLGKTQEETLKSLASNSARSKLQGRADAPLIGPDPFRASRPSRHGGYMPTAHIPSQNKPWMYRMTHFAQHMCFGASRYITRCQRLCFASFGSYSSLLRTSTGEKTCGNSAPRHSSQLN